jgi:hypothetical protein
VLARREIIFRQAEALYPAGTHIFTPVFVGAGFQSIAMRATKVAWPKAIAELFAGYIEFSDDAGLTWRRIASWRESGNDVRDARTGALLHYSYLQLHLSARQDHPVYTHKDTWVRATFDCSMPITTAITIEGS